MLAEKIINEVKSSLKYGPTNNVVNPINKLKNKGIKISANGMKTLKFSSNVKELEIHEVPLR